MSKAPLVLAFALVLGLAASARLDPSIPFLFASDTLTWWAHPEPLSTPADRAPHQLVFAFTPSAPGRLELAVMSRFRLLDGDHLLLAGPVPGESWKHIVRVTVAARELRLEAQDERFLPVVGLGGEARPGQVQVLGRGQDTTAITAASLLRPRPALAGTGAGLAWVALAVLGLTAALVLRRGHAPAIVGPARPRLVLLILAVHAAVALWNVTLFPLGRGLDADGHVEYARTILAERRLPPPDRGFQTYHPPLYHALGALAIAATGSERSLQALSAVAGFALVAACAALLGAARWRSLALVAFLPVLLIGEPQATNEILHAALATAALVTAALAAAAGRRRLAWTLLCGLLAGLALLTKYTAVLCLPALALALLPGGGEDGGRGKSAGRGSAVIALILALAVGVWPYLDRWRDFGDPFVGNWDEALGRPYRQPPGFRTASYFLRFGAALFAHPFEARRASLWDSLYVSTIGDGFGRFVAPRAPAQHAALLALAWLGLPLMLITALGLARILWQPPSSGRIEQAGALLILLSLAAVVRFNLELPYWSTAKGVFLLHLALPGALAFERGRQAVIARGGRPAQVAIDLAIAGFSALSLATFLYRE